MTQITNVLLMLAFTVFFSFIAVFFTIFIDKIIDVDKLVDSIPKIIMYHCFMQEI